MRSLTVGEERLLRTALTTEKSVMDLRAAKAGRTLSPGEKKRAKKLRSLGNLIDSDRIVVIT